jgi:hypothetical protein
MIVATLFGLAESLESPARLAWRWRWRKAAACNRGMAAVTIVLVVWLKMADLTIDLG